MASTPVAPPGVFPPPPGVTPNFVDPPQHALGRLPLIVIFTVLSTVFLALRLWTKVHILKVFGWEDFCITLAWAFNIVQMGLLIRTLQLGSATHLWNLTVQNFPEYSRCTAVAQLVYSPVVGLPKIAILLFYLRLNPSRSFRISVWIVIVVVWAYIIAIFLVKLFNCNPVQKFWDPMIEGKCLNERPIFLTIPIAGTILDLAVLLLPIPMIYHLQVNVRTKLAIGAIFSFCSCTMIVSALRIWSVSKLLDATDLTWDATISDDLTVIESNMMIVCGSILVLRPFCRRYLPFLLAGDKSKPSKDILFGPNDPLKHDGPIGPPTKSEYRTKVHGGKSGGSGKKALWGVSFGSTTLAREDEDDLESLSAELKRLPPTAASMGGAADGKDTHDRVNEYGQQHHYTPQNERSLANDDNAQGALSETGIMKTVSLHVR